MTLRIVKRSGRGIGNKASVVSMTNSLDNDSVESLTMKNNYHYAVDKNWKLF